MTEVVHFKPLPYANRLARYRNRECVSPRLLGTALLLGPVVPLTCSAVFAQKSDLHHCIVSTESAIASDWAAVWGDLTAALSSMGHGGW